MESTSAVHDRRTLSCISVFNVVRSKSCGKIGLVTAVANEVDWYDSCLVSPDHIDVQWDNDTNRKRVNRNDVTLVTKFHTIGRFVTSVLDPSGPCGVVIGVNILVDLLTPDGSILKDVNTTELIHVKEISRHRLVRLGSSIGRVDYFIDNVTVLFDNGSVCEFIDEADEMTLKPIDNLTKIDRVFPNYPDYYPGQRVKTAFISAFPRNPRFLPGLWD